MSLAQSVRLIHETVNKTLHNSPLKDRPVTILAASKGQSQEHIIQAIASGIGDFGENRVQEAEAKWPPLRKTYPQVRLHLIGPLQTNKVKKALGLFDVIQTIDRPKLAEVLSAELRALSKEKSQHSALKTQHFFIQVNIGKEPQKAGAMPDEVDALIEYCRSLHLPVVGLMCIPPSQHPPAPYFALLREMARRNGLAELSMGMSEDYETAVRMGATCIRLGRVLFGERDVTDMSN